MKPLLLSVLLTMPLIARHAEPDWKTAKVLDANMAKSLPGDPATGLHPFTLESNQLLLQSPDFSYIIRDDRFRGGANPAEVFTLSIAGRHHGCHFIVGDSIKFYQDRLELVVLDADGKRCKVNVLRQERIAPQH